MTRVTFYLLDPHGPSAEQFACRLVEKAWRGGLPMHLYTEDRHQCEAMDRLLWAWREDSFLPHAILSEPSATSNSKEPSATLNKLALIRETPITLSFEPPELGQKPLLINLDRTVPDFFRAFSRVCEIVVQHPDLKEASRRKYRAYQKAGIKPETHSMGAGSH